jgi:membrane-bound serine protease (ClpP class)
MVHHPIILGPKLIVMAILIVVLFILHGNLPPDQFKVALIVSSVGFLCFIIILWVVAYKLLSNPESKVAKATTLSTQARAEDGYVSSSGEFEKLLGKQGEAISALRPSGTVTIGGDRISVVTSGEFITKGALVEVMSVKGSKVVVRELPNDSI